MGAARTNRWERRPDERPQEVLEAALRVFAERGYRGTRVDDVAEAAGVTKGTIYHYFDTKEALLLGVIEYSQKAAFGRVEDLLRDDKLAASTRIRLFVRRLFSGSDPRRRALLSLLMRGIAHEVPVVHDAWLRTGPKRFWVLLAKLVTEGVSRGEFSADVDADVMSRILISGLMVQFLWQQHAGSVTGLAIDEDRLIDSAVDQFLAALRPVSRGRRRANSTRR